MDPVGGTWTAAAAVLSVPRKGLKAVWGPVSQLFIVGPGDNGGDTDVSDMIAALPEGWIVTGSPTANKARHFYSLTPTSGVILMAGGASSVHGATLQYAEYFDEVLKTWTETSEMTYCRYNHAAVALPDGRVMVMAGMGYPVTRPGTIAPLDSVEIWDPVSGKWSNGPKLPVAMSYANATLNSQNEVVLFGSAGPFILGTNGKWTRALDSTSVASLCSSMSIVNDIVLVSSIESDPTGFGLGLTTWALTQGEKGVGVAHSAKQYSATRINSNQFYVSLDDEGYMYNATGTSLKVATPSNTTVGPYLLDPKGAVAYTGIETTLTQDIEKNVSYGSISVSDNSSFPSSGYIAIAFGYDNMAGPIKYTGKSSTTGLIVDASYKFADDIANGSYVTYLPHKGPATDVGAGAWITPSNIGRIQAVKAIRSALAAGINSDIIVKYPSDRGLGNEGYPISGAAKLSDSVRIFASDDIEADVEAAKGA
jgi:hypothetical protein